MRKIMAKFRKKVNNAGLTLIEILVAMAILTIAIIPLMSGYIYSVRHNNMAKDMQQTSILASTMIENCKAYDLTTIKSMVTSGKFMPDATSNIVAIDTDTQYLCYFDDVKVYDGSNQIYDLSMEIKNMGGESDLMYYEDMSPYNDAFFMADTTKSTGTPQATMEEVQLQAYEYALGKMKDKINLHSTTKTPDNSSVNISEADIDYSLKNSTKNDGLLKITRTITVKIRKDAGGLQTVDIVCSYTFNTDGDFYYTIPQLDADNNGVPDEVSVNLSGAVDAWDGRTFRIYSNANDKTKAKIENIYLFYTPSYNNVGMNFENDVINIDSDLAETVNLYVMKQKKYGMTDDQIMNAENNYKPTFTSSISVGGKAIIYHNLNENIGSDTAVVGWTEPTISDLEFKDTFVQQDSKQLMYTVEVKVYDKNSYKNDGVTKGMTTEALASMDGTFLNW